MAPNPSAVAIQAAVDGNLRLLKKMAKKMDLRDAKTAGNVNVLHLAVAMGHLEICRFLVEESGLDVNSATDDGDTPISQSVSLGNVGVLRLLLDHGGDPEMPNAKGWTPLLLAVGKNDQAVKVLLEYGADPNRVTHGTVPLMTACCEGSLKCMKALLEGGADVNFRIPYGIPSVLWKAVIDGSTETVNFLLEAGADANTFYEFGERPIMYAARAGRCDLVEILFPHTKPIASVANWSVEGIISATKSMPFEATDASMGGGKTRGDRAFEKGDYLVASCYYKVAQKKDPSDATLFASRSLSLFHAGYGEDALIDAQKCKKICPSWWKAWYCEGAALKLLKNYSGAANAFVEALMLDPTNAEIKTALREAIDALGCAARSEEQNLELHMLD